MSITLRTLLAWTRRLADAGLDTPSPGRTGDELAGRVAGAVGELTRAALAGAVATRLDQWTEQESSAGDDEPVTGDCRCPTWRQLSDALAAAAVAAGSVPGGRGVAVALGAAAAVADLLARSHPDRPAN